MATALLLTFSRGALGVCVLGMIVYALLARPRGLLTAVVAVVPACLIALRSAWNAPLLALDDLTRRAAVAQGHHVAIVVIVCALGAGLLRLALLPVDARLAQARLRVLPRSTMLRATLGAGTVTFAVAMAVGLGLPGRAAHEYQRFANPAAVPTAAVTRNRLTDPANNGRVLLWRAAQHLAGEHPVIGLGAGTFQVAWTGVRTQPVYVTDAHQLYLQSVAELGVVGLALIALVVGGILVGIAGRICGPNRGLYAAIFAAVLAWAIHGALDWDWQMPAVTIWVFILGGLALAQPAGKPRMRDTPRWRTGLALVWLLIAVAPLLGAASYARLHAAAADVRAGDCAAAKQQALSSLDWYASRADAYSIIGLCDLREGFPSAAPAAMNKAAGLDPSNWQEAYWLAVAQAGVGQDPRPAAQRALALNPLEPLTRRLVRRLSSSSSLVWEHAAPALREAAVRAGVFAVSDL